MFALFARSASTICSFIHNMAYMRSAGVWHITHYPHTFGNRTREQVLGERFLLLCIARCFVSQSHYHCEYTGIGLLIHVYFSFHHIFFHFDFLFVSSLPRISTISTRWSIYYYCAVYYTQPEISFFPTLRHQFTVHHNHIPQSTISKANCLK